MKPQPGDLVKVRSSWNGEEKYDVDGFGMYIREYGDGVPDTKLHEVMMGGHVHFFFLYELKVIHETDSTKRDELIAHDNVFIPN